MAAEGREASDGGTITCADGRGGLGSLAVTSSAIAHQSAATQAAIRAALERRAAAYRTSDGLTLPIAFKIGVGRKTH